VQPYFIWNNVDSRSMGLVVTSYPPIIRPPERIIQQTIPGRAGSVILTEGANVYEAYIKSFVIGLKPGAPAQPVINWLRGQGRAVFGNEPDFAYTGRIISAVQFDKVGQWLMKSAGVQLLTQPFKTRAVPEENLSVTGASTSIYNPGDVGASPRILLTYTGSVEISIGDTTMALSNVAAPLVIDCDAGMITLTDGTPWLGSWSGDFLKIPAGNSTLTLSQPAAQLTITPRWRWL
jgi:phage-related protein